LWKELALAGIFLKQGFGERKRGAACEKAQQMTIFPILVKSEPSQDNADAEGESVYQTCLLFYFYQ
jgi:hypothetical protein